MSTPQSPVQEETEVSRSQTPPQLKAVRKFDIGVVLSIVVVAAGGLFYLGRLDERVTNARERTEHVEGQINRLAERLDQQLDAIETARDQAIGQIRALSAPQDNPVVFQDGRLSSGYGMGVETSEGSTDWVRVTNEHIRMAYPPGQVWGAVFITVGQPTEPPRPARDFTAFRALSVEIRGDKGGEYVLLGVKDSADPDDGSETKVRLAGLTRDWQRFEIPLSRFRTGDIKTLYVVAEFVFETRPQTVYCRKITFLR